MNPQFSVVIPVYNSEAYIASCLDSVVSAADGYSVEVVLIDDGSIDGSGKIIKDYVKQYDWFVFISQENKGPSAARNAGLAIAKGDYIAFLDSDDQLSKSYFSVLDPYCRQKPDIIVFGYERVFVGKESKKLSPKPREHKGSSDDLLKSVSKDRELFWFSWTKVFSRKSVSGIRFSEEIRLGEDTIFNIEAVSRSSHIIRVPHVLYRYYEVEGSLSSPRYKPGLLKNMERHFEARVNLHARSGGVGSEVINDICDYYLLHIVPWLISNAMQIPGIKDKVLELKAARASFLVKTCLAWGGTTPPSKGFKVVYAMFRARMFLALIAWLSLRNRRALKKSVGES